MSDHRPRGFTLVEVLVALAVLAIGLAGVMRLSAQTINDTIALRDRNLAMWIAQNKLTKHMIDRDWPDIATKDEEEKMAGRKWYWREVVSENEKTKNYRKVEITVRASEKDENTLTSMWIFVRKP